MKDKDTLIAVTVGILLFFGWNPLMHKLGLVPDKPIIINEDTKDKITKENPKSNTDTKSTNPTTPTEVTTIPSVSNHIKIENFISNTTDDKNISLNSQGTLYAKVFLSTKGTGIQSVLLNKYLKDYNSKAGDFVKIGESSLPFCSLQFAKAGFECENTKIISGGKAEDDFITIERTVKGKPIIIRERWQISHDKEYFIDYTLTVLNTSKDKLQIAKLPIAAGGVRSKPAGVKVSRYNGQAALAHIMFKEKSKSYPLKKIKKLDAEDKKELANSKIKWVAFHTKYFMSSLISEKFDFVGVNLDATPNPVADKNIQGDDKKVDWLYGTVYIPEITLGEGESKEFKIKCYVGPKENQRLRKMSNGMADLMNMDRFLFWHFKWMGGITALILKTLNWLNTIFNSKWGYGFAIIIITLIIKMIMWPLTHKSTVSMRNMQTMQPLVAKLKEDYANDPQLLQRKTMELYKEHGVNPVGSCLPMFLQIPVFFALFSTFRAAIELRHAPFLGWVHDLSMPDTIFSIAGLPIRPLALTMAVTMLLQQKLTPKTGDQNQARMMYFMSLFMLVLFYGMPAGLTLYWTVNQIFSIVQNLIINKKMEKQKTK